MLNNAFLLISALVAISLLGFAVRVAFFSEEGLSWDMLLGELQFFWSRVLNGRKFIPLQVGISWALGGWLYQQRQLFFPVSLLLLVHGIYRFADGLSYVIMRSAVAAWMPTTGPHDGAPHHQTRTNNP